MTNLREAFAEVVEQMNAVLDEGGQHLQMLSLEVSRDGETHEHSFVPSGASATDIRSVSKAFVCVTFGALIDQDFQFGTQPLGLDTKVWPVLQTLVRLENRSNQARWEQMTFRHLLTHTMGYDHGLMFSSDIAGIPEQELLSYVVNADLAHDPGDHYVYSNVGPFLVSVLIQAASGRLFADVCRDLLLEPLGVKSFQWKMYGDHTAGCTGLMIRNQDMHKLGQVLLSHGRYKSHRIVSESWVREMTRLHVLTPTMFDASRALPKYGYGLFTIVTDSDVFYYDGANGQYLIIVPHSGIVISCTARQEDNKPITRALLPLFSQAPNRT